MRVSHLFPLERKERGERWPRRHTSPVRERESEAQEKRDLGRLERKGNLDEREKRERGGAPPPSQPGGREAGERERAERRQRGRRAER
eukprot:scaffold19382_cov22-Tisochrysis_lutea.AAC.1